DHGGRGTLVNHDALLEAVAVVAEDGSRKWGPRGSILARQRARYQPSPMVRRSVHATRATGAAHAGTQTRRSRPSLATQVHGPVNSPGMANAVPTPISPYKNNASPAPANFAARAAPMASATPVTTARSQKQRAIVMPPGPEAQTMAPGTASTPARVALTQNGMLYSVAAVPRPSAPTPSVSPVAGSTRHHASSPPALGSAAGSTTAYPRSTSPRSAGMAAATSARPTRSSRPATSNGATTTAPGPASAKAA